MAQLCVLLHILLLTEWGMETGMMVGPLEKDVCLKQTPQQGRDETSGAISGNSPFSLVLWGPLCLTGPESHHTSASQCVAQLWLHVQRYRSKRLNCLFVLGGTQLLRTNNSRALSKQSKGSLPLERPLHSEAKMGHSHTRPTEVAPVGALPPSPRTVCALRLAEPPHRFCCHYQHFSYPERAMSYSPPYSPSLFKRPDRR